MDAGEAELEHARRRIAEQLEDPRGRARGERRRQPHGSRRAASAQIPSSAAPAVKRSVTTNGPPSDAAADQRPTSPRSERSRTPRNGALLA